MADNKTEVEDIQFPVGRYPAAVDNKGRMKLPVIFSNYFKSLAERKPALADDSLFVTSLDRSTLRIYLLEEWVKTRGEMVSGREVNYLYFNGEDLGAIAKMDKQNRVLINTELRRELDLQAGGVVHLFWEKDHALGLTDAHYQALLKQARNAAKTDPRLRSTPRPL
ncbi:MAG: hypothetical protein M3N08_05290 [Pseudomonadota bacterium]|nr:hypothetical protein [Pseudomonadota bacterium]